MTNICDEWMPHGWCLTYAIENIYVGNYIYLLKFMEYSDRNIHIVNLTYLLKFMEYSDRKKSKFKPEGKRITCFFVWVMSDVWLSDKPYKAADLLTLSRRLPFARGLILS